MADFELQATPVLSSPQHKRPQIQVLDDSQKWEDGVVKIAGYKSDLTRTILWWVGVVFTAGLSTLAHPVRAPLL